jgi:hypothetical protein
MRLSTLASIVSLFLLQSLTASAQTWSDSLTKAERFWSRSGGYAREMALGAGGFGMLGDSGIKTIPVNPYSVDPIFILQNPAYLGHYASQLWFDGGFAYNGGAGQNFRGSFGVTDNFTLGLVLARKDAAGVTLLNTTLFNDLTIFANNFPYSPPDNTWEVLGAIKAGSADIGLGLSYASSSAGVEGAGLESSSAKFHQLGISAGALLRGDDDMMLDFDLNALLPGITLTGSTNSGDLSMTVLGINARAMLPIRSEFFIVPIANFYYSKGTSTIVATPKDLTTGSNIDAGVGLNFWQSGLHFVGGMSFGYYKSTQPAIAESHPALESSQTIFPRWNIGAEWPILRWLDVRMGYFASSATQSRETAISATQTSTTNGGAANLYSPFFSGAFDQLGPQPNGLNVGASAHIGRFSVDATIATQALSSITLDVLNNALGFISFSYDFH